MQPLSEATNTTAKPRGRPRGARNKTTTAVDVTVNADILARIEQLEAEKSARDAENARLRAQLADQNNTNRDRQHHEERFGSTNGSDVDPPVESNDSQGSEHIYNLNPDIENSPPLRADNPASLFDDNNELETLADRQRKHQRLERLAEQRRERDRDMQTASQPTASRTVATNQHDDSAPRIPKPKGQAGKDYMIAIEMGLSKSTRGQQSYNTILRSAQDVVSESRIAWQAKWADILADQKAIMFAVLRERHPFLKRFENDWASEAIIRQYLKNKKKTHYRQGTLEVTRPTERRNRLYTRLFTPQYGYLRTNAAARDQSKSRKCKAIQDHQRRKENARAAKERRKARKEGQQRLRRIIDEEPEEESEKGRDKFIEGSSRDGGNSVGQEGENDDVDVDEVLG
ncbi:hypothetical protein K435DRAFT_860581 [Dendrothele bispora CBS 962.96]|uniref:Uncharacterized protein n=1 Tax=Dendrothele bispora (strain CBS 962.96) TaxID=1314807 RepID=A0A4S8LYT7_DENBC|nr:hypothetical protein K435DRAFT_860581 [Dendrothele bispora CBS 962.96]